MNWIVLATVIYVLVAVAMIVLILMQRGAGAQAGSGFGAGASATVFGASGSANFLSKTTKWLAIIFFSMSLGMAWYASQHGGRLMPAQASQDVGLMGAIPEAGEPADAAAPAANDALPAPAGPVEPAPAAPAAEGPAQAPAASGTPADAPSEAQPPAQENPPQGDSGG